jgi:site-specific recombinase
MAVLFDTLKLADRLEAAGMPPRQAHETAAALAETMTGDLVTRDYLDRRLAETEAKVRGWMIGQAFAIVGAVAAIIGVAAALIRLLH